MEKNLVSIITPCYNCEAYLERLLDSVLKQVYPFIEMFAIDDGSTDHTKDIIQAYIPRFEQKGYRLNYVYQDNAGQSAALNNGLKMVNGEYLVWPDSDDWYSSEKSIEILVRTLEHTDDNVSMARCLNIHYAEESMKETQRSIYSDVYKEETLFEDCLYGQHGFWYQPGGYMIKMSVFDKEIKNREIYTEKFAGQNIQILLPLLYDYKCITIEDYLYSILDRQESHSHQCDGVKYLNRIEAYTNTKVATIRSLQSMDDNQKDRYTRHLIEDGNRGLMSMALSLNRRSDAWRYYRNLQQIGSKVPFIEKFSLYLCGLPFYQYLDIMKYRFVYGRK